MSIAGPYLQYRDALLDLVASLFVVVTARLNIQGCKQELSVTSRTGVVSLSPCKRRSDFGVELAKMAIARGRLAAQSRLTLPFLSPEPGSLNPSDNSCLHPLYKMSQLNARYLLYN